MNDIIVMFDRKREALDEWRWFSDRYREKIMKSFRNRLLIVIPQGQIFFRWKTCEKIPNGKKMKYEDFLMWFRHKDDAPKIVIPKRDFNKAFVIKHLLKCGTCSYKHKGKCTNPTEDTFNEIVDDDCSCDSYLPDERIKRYL